MATKTVYDDVYIKLQDDTEIVLRPLPIGLLKRFMAAWEKLGNVEEDTDTFDVFLTCAGIAISRELKVKFEKPLESEAELADDYREYLEDTLDTPTIYKIIEVCAGINLADPKLIQEAEKVLAEADGTS